VDSLDNSIVPPQNQELEKLRYFSKIEARDRAQTHLCNIDEPFLIISYLRLDSVPNQKSVLGHFDRKNKNWIKACFVDCPGLSNS
jgi:hypothetical protein